MASIGTQHTVKAYDDELKRLQDTIKRMGLLAADQLEAAIAAIGSRDPEQASLVIAGDAQVDAGDEAVNELTVRLLALRSPVANDLRVVVSSLKIAGELERVADLAVNIAKRTLLLNQFQPLAPMAAIARMGEQVAVLLRDVVAAYRHGDTDTALKVWAQDQDVDDQCSALFRELLTYMMEDPRSITACSHLMFVAKNIERCGDHATNIAELVHYMVTGEAVGGQRPKGDTSSFRLD